MPRVNNAAVEPPHEQDDRQESARLSPAADHAATIQLPEEMRPLAIEFGRKLREIFRAEEEIKRNPLKASMVLGAAGLDPARYMSLLRAPARERDRLLHWLRLANRVHQATGRALTVSMPSHRDARLRLVHRASTKMYAFSIEPTHWHLYTDGSPAESALMELVGKIEGPATEGRPWNAAGVATVVDQIVDQAMWQLFRRMIAGRIAYVAGTDRYTDDSALAIKAALADAKAWARSYRLWWAPLVMSGWGLHDEVSDERATVAALAPLLSTCDIGEVIRPGDDRATWKAGDRLAKLRTRGWTPGHKTTGKGRPPGKSTKSKHRAK